MKMTIDERITRAQIADTYRMTSRIRKEGEELISYADRIEGFLRSLESGLSQEGEFDFVKAMGTRKGLNLSRRGLANKIVETEEYSFNPDSLQIVISNYERGFLNPEPLGRSKNARAYLIWLKNTGYNPFDI